MRKKYDIHAERANYGRSVDLFICLADSTDAAQRIVAARPIEFATVDDFAAYEPCLRMNPEDAQQLMDELWRAGIRPTEGSGSAGSMVATEKHLADMRTIALGAVKKAVVID